MVVPPEQLPIPECQQMDKAAACPHLTTRQAIKCSPDTGFTLVYTPKHTGTLESPLLTSNFFIAFVPFRKVIGVSLKFFNGQKLSELFYFCIHLGDLHI